MLRRSLFISLVFLAFCALPETVFSEGMARSKRKFYYEESPGTVRSVRIIRHYRRVPIVHPPAKTDARIGPRLRRAVTIAEERAHARTKARCWRYVKEALLAAGVVNFYPKTHYAFQAGDELVREHGFKRLPNIPDPYAAPLGSVLVYNRGGGRPGHVEIRTRNGFVSDYRSKNRCKYKLIGVYAKKV